MARAAQKAAKPYVGFVAGDIEAQADRIIRSKGIEKAIYRILARHLVKKEVKWCRNASLIYAYSEDLANRHRNCRGEVRLFRTPHLSQRDFHQREDTCKTDVIRLLRVCWLLPSKGLEVLIDSVRLGRSAGIDFRLRIVGKEREAGYRDSLLKLAKEKGIERFVEIVDWVPFDKIGAEYSSSDIQVVSSFAEGTPRCIVEGFARGLPVVTADRVWGLTDLKLNIEVIR